MKMLCGKDGTKKERKEQEERERANQKKITGKPDIKMFVATSIHQCHFHLFAEHFWYEI